MPSIDVKTAICVVLAILVLAACAPLTQYRTENAPCENHGLHESPECESHALQRFTDPEAKHVQYTLGFIEFDDQGLLIDRPQMNSVLKHIANLDNDLLLVVFMHGWHHSAAPGDSNIEDFRQALLGLARSENIATRCSVEYQREQAQTDITECSSEGKPTINPRKVVGVYLGWRGDSLKSPLLNWSTFWERKATAHRVGHVGVTEVLAKLERIKNRKNEINCEKENPCSNRNKLVVIGHSFGGAAVFSALSQVLESRLIRTGGFSGLGKLAPSESQTIEGFGDLIVLVNPAFEALLFDPIKLMSVDHGHYPPDQLPVLAVLTSEGDDYTKKWFTFGRRFSTLFDREHVSQPSQGEKSGKEDLKKDANITALGHYRPYETHFLQFELHQEATPKQEAIEPANLLRAGDCWRRGASRIEFTSSVLERADKVMARNPYLIVRIDDKLIENDKKEESEKSHHNDVWDNDLVEFVKQLILISSQTPLQTALIKDPGIAPCRVIQRQRS